MYIVLKGIRWQGVGAGFYEHGNKSSGSIKACYSFGRLLATFLSGSEAGLEAKITRDGWGAGYNAS
jgi:hypothetical protein